MPVANQNARGAPVWRELTSITYSEVHALLALGLSKLSKSLRGTRDGPAPCDARQQYGRMACVDCQTVMSDEPWPGDLQPADCGVRRQHHPESSNFAVPMTAKWLAISAATLALAACSIPLTRSTEQSDSNTAEADDAECQSLGSRPGEAYVQCRIAKDRQRR
jgi:hypothetical protein